MKLQKEVISNKKTASRKKGCSCQKARVKKMIKSMVAAKEMIVIVH